MPNAGARLGGVDLAKDVTTRGFMGADREHAQSLAGKAGLYDRAKKPNRGGRTDYEKTAAQRFHYRGRRLPRRGSNHGAQAYPAIEGMRNVQRLLKTQNPRIAEINVDDLVDNRYIRKLDESGFFERIYVK